MFILPFWIFPDFERKVFQTFGQKTSKICQNYLLRVQRNNLWLEFFFKFWIVSDFLQKPLAWFSKFYLRVQSKNCGKNSFFVFLFAIFFRLLGNIFSDFWPKHFKKLWKLTSACPQEQLEALNFFKKIWTVLNFLQKPLAWFSKIYLRVQSKICGRNNFFYSSFLNFFEVWAKIFQTSGQKTSRSFQNYILRVQRYSLWLEILRHGSKNSIYMSRVKISEGTVFLFFFSEFFRILSEKFLRLAAKKRQEFVKTTFYVSRVTICGLNFFKFRIVSDFLQKPLAWFSNFYLRLQSKNCGRNSFLIFLRGFFSDFECKIFQTFGQKTSKSCQN